MSVIPEPTKIDLTPYYCEVFRAGRKYLSDPEIAEAYRQEKERDLVKIDRKQEPLVWTPRRMNAVINKAINDKMGTTEINYTGIR